MNRIWVNAQQSYPIIIQRGLLETQSVLQTCAELAREWVIITDDTVRALYAESLSQRMREHFRVHLISVPPGEGSKTREVKAQIEDQMQAYGCGRDVGVMAVGGGVVTDLAGFVAATYCRGVPAVYVPTTLLAIVDATVGGKTGVNTPQGKNLIGTFTQPRAVFVDPIVLSTLDQAVFIDGVIESLKHALIADRDFFEFIDTQAEKILQSEPSVLEELMRRSIEIKKTIVEKDTLERNQRALCNFGHTIAHALEADSNYELRHGLAVAIGLLIESYYSTVVAGLSPTDFEKLKNCLLKFGLGSLMERVVWNVEKLRSYLANDKKTRDHVPHFVLLSAIGRPYIEAGQITHPLSNDLIEEGIKKGSSLFLIPARY